MHVVRVGEDGMAEVYDLEAYRKKLKEEELKQEAPLEKVPDLEEIASVMMMSSDELFVELLARVEYGESLREDLLSTSTLIAELTNRALHMELLCEMASKLSK